MNPRTFVILALALACSACAQERTPAISGFQASYLNGPTEVDEGLEAKHTMKKTLSDKMLTAIALERVTGRKPDPARFMETY